MVKSKPITFRVCNFVGQETAIHYRKIYSQLENANCSFSLGTPAFFAFSAPSWKNFFHLALINRLRRFAFSTLKLWNRVYWKSWSNDFKSFLSWFFKPYKQSIDIECPMYHLLRIKDKSNRIHSKHWLCFYFIYRTILRFCF